MNNPVNFETANLLKEKGFNIPTFYYYENEKLIEPYLKNGSSSDVEFRVDLSDLKEHFNKWSKRISAPTIAEVVMWLYEKHGFWIHAMMSFKEFTPYIQYNWNYKKDKIEKVLEFMEKRYNTPTEVYEVAIEYTLNHLL